MSLGFAGVQLASLLAVIASPGFLLQSETMIFFAVGIPSSIALWFLQRPKRLRHARTKNVLKWIPPVSFSFVLMLVFASFEIYAAIAFALVSVFLAINLFISH